MKNLQQKLKTLVPSAFSLTPQILNFDLDKIQGSFKIQNLTVHQLNFCVLASNPHIFRFSNTFITLGPCENQKIVIKINMYPNLNLSSITANTYISVFCYDMDLNDKKLEWENIEDKIFIRKDITLHFIEPENSKNSLKINFAHSSNQVIENTFFIQKIVMQNYIMESFDDESKKIIQDYCETHFGFKGAYQNGHNILIYTYNEEEKNQITLKKNEIVVIQQNQRLFFRIYKPFYLIQNKPHSIEDIIDPLPPRINIRLQKQKQKERETREKQRTIRKMSHQPTMSPGHTDPIQVVQNDKKNNQQPQRVRHKSQTEEPAKQQGQFNQTPKKTDDNPEILTQILKMFSLNTLTDTLIDTLIPSKQNKKNIVTPIKVINEEEKQPINNTKGKVQVVSITNIQTYHVVKRILLFADYKKIVSISEQNVIKVFDVEMGCEIGQFKETCFNKNQILFLEEWRYPLCNADENYKFQKDDPQKEKKVIYTATTQEARFVIGASDGMIRIFCINTMKLEQIFSSRLLVPSCLEFLPDRGMFILGGTPNTTIFAQKRKYNSLRFFRMDSLQEKPKHKIEKLYEDEMIQSIVYTDNSKINETQKVRSYTRLNNTLGVITANFDKDGNQLDKTARILFLFIDRMNNLTTLFQLNCDMLNIRGVDHITYLFTTGKFGIIESNNTFGTKKLNETVQQVKKIIINFFFRNYKQKKDLKVEQNVSHLVYRIRRVGKNYNKIQISLQMIVPNNLFLIPDQSNLTLMFQNIGNEKEILKYHVSNGEQLYNSITHLTVSGQCIAAVIDNTINIMRVIVQEE